MEQKLFYSKADGMYHIKAFWDNADETEDLPSLSEAIAGVKKKQTSFKRIKQYLGTKHETTVTQDQVQGTEAEPQRTRRFKVKPKPEFLRVPGVGIRKISG